MGVYRVQRITFPKSGLARDQVVNSFYFQTAFQDSASPTADTMANTLNGLDEFFNLGVGAGPAVRTFLAESTMATQRVGYKIYNMDHPLKRVPIGGPHAAQNITPIIATAPLPSEVAICLSFRGAATSGQAMGRRRGRIYVGPLNTAAVEADPITGQARPTVALQNALIGAGNRLADWVALSGGVWSIYSPTARAAGSGSALSGITNITDVWCDNAFDTQRRRGQTASARVTATV